MKRRFLMIFIISITISSCQYFYNIKKENGREYYMNKKGQKIYVSRVKDKYYINDKGDTIYHFFYRKKNKF